MDVWVFEADLNTNLIGAYVCLHKAVEGGRHLDSLGSEEDGLRKVPKVFIANGNVVPWQPVPEAMTLGIGKAALAHLVQGEVSVRNTGKRGGGSTLLVRPQRREGRCRTKRWTGRDMEWSM